MESKIVFCTRIGQILDSEERFGLPYGSPSPFSFAFRDQKFSLKENRSNKYYMNLRSCKNINNYRHQVEELYRDLQIEIEVYGETRKFPIQKIEIPKESQQELAKVAEKFGKRELIDLGSPLVLLSSLPLPRLLRKPPQGKSRSEYLPRFSTNKMIDVAVVVHEDQVELGCKYLSAEISKTLAPMESHIAFVTKLSKHLKNYIAHPIGISLRGTMADNPAVFEHSLRVPAYSNNFFESPEHEYWSVFDIDLDIFCGEEDFADILKCLNNPEIFWDTNAEIKGLHRNKAQQTLQFKRGEDKKSVEIYLMTDEWVLESVQRHLKLGLEHPWAYYYASSYPLLFDDWDDFMKSLTEHIFS